MRSPPPMTLFVRGLCSMSEWIIFLLPLSVRYISIKKDRVEIPHGWRAIRVVSQDDQIRDWVAEECSGRVIIKSVPVVDFGPTNIVTYYLFEQDADAIAFMLRWK